MLGLGEDEIKIRRKWCKDPGKMTLASGECDVRIREYDVKNPIQFKFKTFISITI